MDAKSFFEYDFGACLFPLTTNLLLIKHHHAALQAYVAKVLSDSPAHIADNFLPQTRVHAAKPRNHLRRTVVLDPVASYFLYDLISRNRAAFGTGSKSNRRSFGYTFDKKKPVAVSRAYRNFLKQMEVGRKQYDHRTPRANVK